MTALQTHRETHLQQGSVHGAHQEAVQAQQVEMMHPVQHKVQVVMVCPGHDHRPVACHALHQLPASTSASWLCTQLVHVACCQSALAAQNGHRK